MTIDAKTQAVIDQINAEVEADGGPVPDSMLASLGFTDVGANGWPIWKSPESHRGGPSCCIFVDTMMGCDGWEVGWDGDRSMITPPMSLGQLLRLADGLGIVLTRRWQDVGVVPDLLAACKAVLPWVVLATADGDPMRHPKSIQNAKEDLATLVAAIARAGA